MPWDRWLPRRCCSLAAPAGQYRLDWRHGGNCPGARTRLEAQFRASRGDGNDSRLAFLVLLDRYSPWAWIAVPTAAVTGVFNAQVHLDSFDAFLTTEYGRFLIVKLVLICLIV